MLPASLDGVYQPLLSQGFSPKRQRKCKARLSGDVGWVVNLEKAIHPGIVAGQENGRRGPHKPKGPLSLGQVL